MLYKVLAQGMAEKTVGFWTRAPMGAQSAQYCLSTYSDVHTDQWQNLLAWRAPDLVQQTKINTRTTGRNAQGK